MDIWLSWTFSSIIHLVGLEIRLHWDGQGLAGDSFCIRDMVWFGDMARLDIWVEWIALVGMEILLGCAGD